MCINVIIIIILYGGTKTFSFLQMREMRNKVSHNLFKVTEVVSNKLCI